MPLLSKTAAMMLPKAPAADSLPAPDVCHAGWFRLPDCPPPLFYFSLNICLSRSRLPEAQQRHVERWRQDGEQRTLRVGTHKKTVR